MPYNSREDKERRSQALQWESWECIRGMNPALLTSLHSSSQPKILHRTWTLKQNKKSLTLNRKRFGVWYSPVRRTMLISFPKKEGDGSLVNVVSNPWAKTHVAMLLCWIRHCINWEAQPAAYLPELILLTHPLCTHGLKRKNTRAHWYCSRDSSSSRAGCRCSDSRTWGAQIKQLKCTWSVFYPKHQEP